MNDSFLLPYGQIGFDGGVKNGRYSGVPNSLSQKIHKIVYRQIKGLITNVKGPVYAI